ncbi:unnamed protein product [Didymodactylos carnosus]|uniref:Uncharacterized protein n=1 Tax=Didymodactylos carnosus TaxID=1234261 RepID=A0A8S2HXQ1_9BILA|nr:unnamed protein product [Didymodactylos carnosus]CAF3687077.1 unnamed protein product [Didymodactylos carnosus]
MLRFTVTEKGSPVLKYSCYQYPKKRENKKSDQLTCGDHSCLSKISLCSQDLSIIKNETTHTCAQDTNTFTTQTMEGDNQNKNGYESSEEIMNSSVTDFSSESDHNEDNNNDHSSEEIDITIDDVREFITSINNVLLKCRKLVNHFRRSTKQTGYLTKTIGKTLRCHSLIIDCPI